MMRTHHFVYLALLTCLSLAHAGDPIKIPRIIPPAGIEVPIEEMARIREGLEKLEPRLNAVKTSKQNKSDVAIYTKAVRYAVDHGEFFDAKDAGRALDLLKTAGERLKELDEGGNPSWTQATGLVVRGYQSAIDGSYQPYGLVIPEQFERSKPAPLYIWLHGRGDKVADLQFIHQRERSVGQISPPNAIVLHPFGRYCNAFKFTGEIDVFEAMSSVMANYKIDPQRIVLWGFSMGGAGTWHLAAHHPDRFVAASAGAGFVETARYQNLDPESVPSYERTLWGLYDVPGYVRNLFNLPFIAYSGELDKQIQAAKMMEAAFAGQGKELTHLIGPGMGHKYHPDVLKDIASRIDEIVSRGRDTTPKSVTLQTRTLRYNQCDWVKIMSLREHWREARVDARMVDQDRLTLTTTNVNELELKTPWRPGAGFNRVKTIEIDGDTIQFLPEAYVSLRRTEKEKWEMGQLQGGSLPLRKTPGRQGPIDDVWMAPFLVVLPSGKAAHPQVDDWTQAEVAHFQDRWRRLFRGDLRMKKDHEVTDQDIRIYNLVLWGDRRSNRLIDNVMDSLPIRWSESAVTVGDESFAAATHLPAMIYPNPENPMHYVVLNSGPKFREAHDKSNSLQTPKLPDWAVIDLSQPPDDKLPGKIAAAGFFDERWQLKPVAKP